MVSESNFFLPQPIQSQMTASLPALQFSFWQGHYICLLHVKFLLSLCLFPSLVTLAGLARDTAASILWSVLLCPMMQEWRGVETSSLRLINCHSCLIEPVQLCPEVRERPASWARGEQVHWTTPVKRKAKVGVLPGEAGCQRGLLTFLCI